LYDSGIEDLAEKHDGYLVDPAQDEHSL